MRRSIASRPPRGVRGRLARYAEADLACYRSEGRRRWSTAIGCLGPAARVGAAPVRCGFRDHLRVVHVAQPAATVDRLSHAVAALDPFRLAGLSPLVTIGGSLIAALAVVGQAIAPGQAWETVSIDERWQLDKWGADAEAEQALENRRRDFLAAARFLELLDQ
jgi:chaperone required for assembly of F1-ATPase